jgi:hypothetical protein
MKWLMLIAVLLLTACTLSKDGENLKVVYGKHGLAVEELAPGKIELRAQVKGSIYETGEQVSVFGACLDVNDRGFPNTYAMLSAWYPNGTVFLTNQSMQQIQTGYFLYVGSMSAVQGTYLTEFTCYVNGTNVQVRAFGEWQNPAWVAQIGNTAAAVGNLSGQIGNLSEQVANVSMQVGEMNLTMVNNFETTWELMSSLNVTVNQTNTNVTNLLYYVASVANGSVDRNDSYLAELLRGVAVATGAPVTGELSTVSAASTPVYFKKWRVEAQVINEYNQVASPPLVNCYVDTNNNPPTVHTLMTYEDSVGAKELTPGTKQYYYWEEKVQRLGDFTYNVTCRYNEVI